jgi:hypothetical protein
MRRATSRAPSVRHSMSARVPVPRHDDRHSA